MTQKQHISQTQNGTRRVAMIAYDDAHILDIVGPLEILSGTNLFLENSVQPYDLFIAAEKAGPLKTSSGMLIHADRSFDDALLDNTPIDTLIVAGGHGTLEAMKNEKLMAYTGMVAANASRIISICTGAMILAELGLLDGKRATTHWWWCPTMAQKYPKVAVEPDAIYIQDGNIWTSAGVTTGMDLALAIVEDDWGHDIALQVARYNVIYMVRPGGQSQFSSQLIAQKAKDPSITRVLDYILQNLHEPLNVTSLASYALMSERSFTRKFNQEIGMTPANYVEAARFQAAKAELEHTNLPIEQVSIKTGFNNPERMRRAFMRHLGISASEYRERFSTMENRHDT